MVLLWYYNGIIIGLTKDLAVNYNGLTLFTGLMFFFKNIVVNLEIYGILSIFAFMFANARNIFL